MSEWKPIETAPRDGSQILKWTGRWFACVEWHSRPDHSAFWEMAHDAQGVYALSGLATHWMPLPEPPK